MGEYISKTLLDDRAFSIWSGNDKQEIWANAHETRENL